MFNKLTKNFNFFESKEFESKEKEEIIKLFSLVENEIKKTNNSSFDESIKNLSNVLELIINDINERKGLGIEPKDTLTNKINELKNKWTDGSTYLFSLMMEIKDASDYSQTKKNLEFKFSKNEVITKLNRIFVISKKLYSDIYGNEYFPEEFDESCYGKIDNNIEAISEKERESIKKDYPSSNYLRINQDVIKSWLSIPHAKLVVPIYQRKYEWTKLNVETLLNDILDRTKDKKDHYFGTIAQKSQSRKSSNHEPNIIKIIDGQQRITTSLLIISAAREVLLKNFNYNKEDEIDWYNDLIKNHYNKNKLGEYIYNPGGSIKENEIFRNILNNEYNNEDLSKSKSKYAKNFLLIKKYIEKELKSKDKIFEFINIFLTKFSVATINFDEKEFSNKQEMEIFENLNSKGLELKITDLIKNHIFNYCDDTTLNKKDNENKITRLYNGIISYISKSDDDNELEFFYSSLSELCNGIESEKDKRLKFNWMKKAVDIFLDEYKEIKNLNDFEEMINYLKEYIKIYKEFIDLNSNHYFIKFIKCDKIIDVIIDKKKRRYFSYFAFLIYQILIKENKFSFDDSHKNKIEKEEIKEIQAIFLEITKFLIKSKIITKQGDSNIKRELMKIANNSFEEIKNLNIKMLSKKIIEKMDELNYSEKYSFNKFKEALEKNDSHNRIIELLLLTERIMSNSLYDGESISRTTYSIEHILPQNADEWIKQIKNEEQKIEFKNDLTTYINKIGNYLILTRKQNSKNSNNIFTKKKEDVYRDLTSPLYKNSNHNIDVSEKNEWNYENIDKRTEELIIYITQNVINK